MEKYGNDMWGIAAVFHRTVSELTVQESHIGLLQKMSPSSYLCSQNVDQMPTSSHHISDHHPPDMHNFLFQHFAITAKRPSTHILKEMEAEIQTWQTSSQKNSQLYLIEVPGSPDRGSTDDYLEKKSPCCSPSSLLKQLADKRDSALIKSNTVCFSYLQVREVSICFMSI